MAFGWTDEDAARIAGKKKPASVAGCLTFGIFPLALIAMLVFWIFSSAMEAKAYERITGKKVSTWDAMWVELRVQAGPQN